MSHFSSSTTLLSEVKDETTSPRRVTRSAKKGDATIPPPPPSSDSQCMSLHEIDKSSFSSGEEGRGGGEVADSQQEARRRRRRSFGRFGEEAASDGPIHSTSRVLNFSLSSLSFDLVLTFAVMSASEISLLSLSGHSSILRRSCYGSTSSYSSSQLGINANNSLRVFWLDDHRGSGERRKVDRKLCSQL